jgi:UDP-2,3-diacylglucosamine hydrolase
LEPQKIQKVSKLNLAPGKKAYFASDFHLGLYPLEKSRIREKDIIRWLDHIKADAGVLFLAGDIFDYWYEYRKVAARGFVRFLAKICEFTDNNIPVYFFTGNHDVWVFDYLPSETGMTVFKHPIEIEINETRFVIGHGDGVGPGDTSYKVLRTIFHNKVLQFLFSKLHPNFTYGLGQAWSKHSRYSKGIAEEFHGMDKEYNIQFAKKYIQTQHVDYFVFGHRHIPMDIRLAENSKLFNLGEWIYSYTYGVFDGSKMSLLSFRDENDQHKINYIIID